MSIADHVASRHQVGKAVGVLIGEFLAAFLTCWLWNMLLPDLFHVPEIGYWQAFGLRFLLALLMPTVRVKVWQWGGKFV